MRPTPWFLVLALATSAAAQFSWQQPHAKVLPTGDLQWAPTTYRYAPSAIVRHIDFEAGDDGNPGTKERPWQHHPLDPEATGLAKAHRGAGTFVFKRGVTYRGQLVGPAPKGDFRLVSDPAWGSGDAVLSGSERVQGFVRANDVRIPGGGQVWVADLNYLPRLVWQIGADGRATRLRLARTPNWRWSNPDDMRSEWFEWEQPDWWTGSFRIPYNKGRAWLAKDTKNLKFPAEALKGAHLWTEYGIVMGSPFPTKIEAYDPEAGTAVIKGPWGDDGETLMTGNRYFLEDSPYFLDEPGEFWFEKKGAGGKLFLRLPNDADPNQATIEAAKRICLVDLAGFDRLEIAGLAFRFTNVNYDLTDREFVNVNVEGSAIRVTGSGRFVGIHHNDFRHGNGAVLVRAPNDRDRIQDVVVADNFIADLDRHAIQISDSSRWGKTQPPFSVVERVKVLRNRIMNTGFRPIRAQHGHCVTVQFAPEQEIAGNVLTKVGGAGLFIFGGKGSGATQDVPLSRVLVHHNKVVEALQFTNDWGSIETWQGGPHYVFNNVSANPGGYWHWSFLGARGKPPEQIDWGTARQGFAYYLDGSFKNYHFNNVAWGKNNTMGSPLANATAFQEIFSFQNTFFNNTAYRFAAGSRRQAPQAGRNKWLGNVFEDLSVWAWINAEARGAAADGNAADAGKQADDFAYETNAFGDNVFAKLPREFGVFEADGERHKTLESFAAANERRRAMRADVGVVSPTPVLADPENMDMRPANRAVEGRGAKVFVPWSLARTVGEWNFTLNRKDPSTVIDEHWYMAYYYTGRESYYKTPRHALTAVGVGEGDYVQGPLENWTRGALRLDGKKRYLVAKHADLAREFEFRANGAMKKASGVKIASPEIGTGNFLIEAYLSTTDPDGVLVAKASDSGYLLEVVGGRLRLRVRAGGQLYTATSASPISDGKWRHVLVEFDRRKGAAIYVGGQLTRLTTDGAPPQGSLANPGDFVVGKDLAATLDFLRVARSTLAESRTTIQELIAWEFDGPMHRDFAGGRPNGKRDAGALERR